MRGFELEPGSFFMCTETSPRCFIIQQVIDLDQALNEVKPSSENEAPVLPFLPWWFTSECRQQLLSIPAESPSQASPGQSTEPSSGTPEPNQMTPEQLKARLKTQLEYYFSRENLINDRFLRCQMDADQYVPIRILASFPKIAALTHDFDLIVEVLRESSQVQVDEAGEKVRPVTKRCTIILREIPENADEKEVKAMFDGCPPYQSLTYGLNNSWYVTFETEEATQKAFLHLQNLGKTFNGKPVYARIKNGGAPIVADGMPYPGKASPDPLKGYITIHDVGHNASSSNSASSVAHNAATSNGAVVYGSHLCTHGPANTCNGHGQCATTCANTFNLGQILASYGFVPRATYRPAVSSASAAGTAVPTTGRSAASAAQLDPMTTSSISFAQPTFLPRAQISMVGVQKPLPQTTESLLVPGMDAYELGSPVEQQSPLSHDGLLPDPPLHAIPNLGRHRITDVPRMTKQRRSPLFYDNRSAAADGYYANASAASAAGGNYYASPAYTTTPLNKIHVTVQPSPSNNGGGNDGEWTSVQHRGGAHQRGNRDGGGGGPGRQRGGSFNENHSSNNNRNYRDMGRDRASSYRQGNTNTGNYGNRLSVRDGQRPRHSPEVSSYSSSSGGGGRGDRRGGGNGGPRRPPLQQYQAQNDAPPKPVVTILGAKPSQCGAASTPTVTKMNAPSVSVAQSLSAESVASKSSASGGNESQQQSQRCKSNSECSEYNFTEVEFPCLIEKERKQQKEKEKLPFSAVVAGKRNAPKPEEKRTSYVQALKKQRPSQPPQQTLPQQPSK